jgi:outer membrane murein-binding lipoprotein Lpp
MKTFITVMFAASTLLLAGCSNKSQDAKIAELDQRVKSLEAQIERLTNAPPPASISAEQIAQLKLWTLDHLESDEVDAVTREYKLQTNLQDFVVKATTIAIMSKQQQ